MTSLFKNPPRAVVRDSQPKRPLVELRDETGELGGHLLCADTVTRGQFGVELCEHRLSNVNERPLKRWSPSPSSPSDLCSLILACKV